MLTLIGCLTVGGVLAQQDSLYTADGIPYFILEEGSGEKARLGQEVEFHIVVTSTDGMTLFSTKEMNVTNFGILGEDKSPEAKVQDNAFIEMRSGGRYQFFIPKSKLANPQVAQLPGNHVIYTIDLIHAGAPQPSAATHLQKLIDSEGLESAAREYKDLQSDNVYGFVFRESEINILGYAYMEAGKYEEAVAVFKMNTDQFPESSNAHDSLGDGYLAKGDKENARRCFQKALELKPDNAYTKKKLDELD